MVKYIEQKFKSILIVRKFVDSWFWEKYAINPYNGCQHGCIYCDSRSAKYHLPTDFENEIIVKTEVAKMLRQRITNARKLLPDVVGMSGASDPYHAAEIKYRNTRKCLAVLNEHKFPVHILTKSKLVLHDIDLLEQIALNNWATVSFTITTTDQKISKFLEPFASTPESRLNSIETIKRNNPNIQSGVLLMPVIPYFTDSKEQLNELVKKSSGAGADYILFSSGMTLRDVQATWFLNKLKKFYPELIPHYEKLYNFRYDAHNYHGNYSVTSEYFKSKNELILELCDKYNMPYRIKRFIPNDFRKINYLVSDMLFEKAYNKQIRGSSYSDWQWAGVKIQNLKKPITELYINSSINELNIKNSSVLSEVINHIETHIPKENTALQLGLF